MAKCSINGSHCSSAHVMYVQFGYGTVLPIQLFISVQIRIRIWIQIAKAMLIQLDPDSDLGHTLMLQKVEFLHEK
jgi:hypothetical protein